MSSNYELIIRESHLDTFGHVNNATYLTLFEEARWELIHSRGFGLPQIKALGLGPVVLEAHLQFKRELLLRQKIRIQTELIDYQGKIGRLRQTLFNEVGEDCCSAEFVFGLFDLKSRKLVKPTEEWLAVFEDSTER